MKRGVGARVYLVPERTDRSFLAMADTLCTRAAYQQQFSDENRLDAIERRTRWVQARADSLEQEAERLPPAARTQMLQHWGRMVTEARESEERDRLDLITARGTAAASWLGGRLQDA